MTPSQAHAQRATRQSARLMARQPAEDAEDPPEQPRAKRPRSRAAPSSRRPGAGAAANTAAASPTATTTATASASVAAAASSSSSAPAPAPAPSRTGESPFRESFFDREIGHTIVGREILIRWSDGEWYDAQVVRYYPATQQYKLVYRADDGLELVALADQDWLLLPRKFSTPSRPVLIGAIVEFKYPRDGLRYRAMVYSATPSGKTLKVAYLDEHSTDSLRGSDWEMVHGSPCEQRLGEDLDGRVREALDLLRDLRENHGVSY